MPGFFGDGGLGGGGLDPSVLQTIIDARDAANAARTAADNAVAQANDAAARAEVALANIPDAPTLLAQVQLAKDWAGKLGGDVEPGLKSAKANAGDAATYANQAATVVANVGSVVTQAEAARDSADAFANAPPGTEIVPGKFSGNHYLDQVVKSAVIAAKIPKKEVRDADLTAGKYTVQVADVNKYLTMLNTTAAAIVLPAGLSTGPGPGGSPAVSFLHVVRRGAGAVTFEAGGGAGGLNALVASEQLFTFGQTTGASKSFSHTASIPAGTKRRVAVLLFAITDVGGSGGAVTASATNTTAFTKVLADTTDGYFNLNGPLSAQWVGTLADSAAATSVVVSGTIGNCLTYALWVVGLKDTSGTTGSAGAAPSVAATVTRTLTPLEAGSVNLFGLAVQGADAQPVALTSSGTPTGAQNTKTPGARTAKDFAFIFGYEARSNTTAVTYTATTAKTTGSATSQGLIVRPDTTAATVTITGGGTPSLSAIGKHANVYVDSDGVTYDVETN